MENREFFESDFFFYKGIYYFVVVFVGMVKI